MKTTAIIIIITIFSRKLTPKKYNLFRSTFWKDTQVRKGSSANYCHDTIT